MSIRSVFNMSMLLRNAFLIAILCMSNLVMGQNRTGDSTSVGTFLSVVKEVERTSGYQFFYREEWVDTLSASSFSASVPLTSWLHETFDHTAIKYFLFGNKVILTYNAPVLTHIDTTIFDVYRNAASRNWNYSFQREAIVENENKTSVNRLKEIGTKAEVDPKKATIAGYVRDSKTGESITGAVVRVAGKELATSSDSFGFYSLTLPTGASNLIVSFIGMKDIEQRILLHGDGKLNFSMEEKVTMLREVMVESDHDENVSGAQMGVNRIDVRAMKNIPKILGENDLLKIAVALPGVKTVGEGAAGFNVRGGNADQNLVTLNEATIYNPSHFLGFFSVFNADAIKSFELYKSAIPAQYGGRLSSIFDLQMKDGNQKQFSGQGGIGPITSQLLFEVPLVKEKTSLMFGGRSTYSNWILKQIPDPSIKNSKASFYDAFARLSHNLNEKNSIYLSLYFSNDSFRLSFDSTFSYYNAIGSLQWRHVFSNNFHSVISVTESRYAYDVTYNEVPENAFKLGFNIQESGVKWDMAATVGKHKFDFGIQSKLYNLNPGFIDKLSEASTTTEREVQREKGSESAIYFSDSYELSPRLAVVAGLRYAVYTAYGPGQFFQYAPGLPKSDDAISDTLRFTAGKPIQTYHGPEYRLSARFKLSENASVKSSLMRTRQFIHMLSNTVSVSPTNTWKLSDPLIKPQLSDQVSAGFYRDFKNKSMELSVELYYKWMKNIIDYKTGASVVLNQSIEQAVLQGDGRAYGIEFLLRKKAGQFNGWLGYTYSRTFARFRGNFDEETINDGKYFPSNFDKPHDVSLVTNYKFTRRYSLSFNFAYSTGRPITYPVGVYKFANAYRINYSNRNQYRIPDYIRADIGFNIEGNHKIKKLAHSFWTISIYNLLGRKNPYSIYFVVDDGIVKGYKLSIFGAPIPTLTYNFKF